jgi:hypothetical protein
MIPLYLDINLLTWLVWDFHDRLLSIRIPKNLVVLTLDISSLSMVTFILMSGLLLCLFLKIMKLVLSMFKDNLFNLNQLEILFISSLIRVSRDMGSLCVKIIFVSSAKIIKCELVEHWGRSLMYNKKRSGPRTEPWGTPQVMLDISEDCWLTETYCFLLDR